MLHCAHTYLLLHCCVLILHCARISCLDTVTGQAYHEAVENLVSFGYDTEEVKRAMAASFNNPDRAFEYLQSVRME